MLILRSEGIDQGSVLVQSFSLVFHELLFELTNLFGVLALSHQTRKSIKVWSIRRNINCYFKPNGFGFRAVTFISKRSWNSAILVSIISCTSIVTFNISNRSLHIYNHKPSQLTDLTGRIKLLFKIAANLGGQRRLLVQLLLLAYPFLLFFFSSFLCFCFVSGFVFVCCYGC